MDDLKIIRKKYGEKMMHLCRELFPTLLETPGVLSEVILSKFAPSRFLYQDIINNGMKYEFKNYIYSYIDVENENKIIKDKTPEELLNEAGYNLYLCTNEEEIQVFKKYYAQGEELCTFNGGRLNSCYVFFAIKKNVEDIKRENFPNPTRQDEYGTSVISIQFSRGNINTLSIKNRYNHKVNNPDCTFNNNLDNIIEGLTESFRKAYGFQFHSNEHNFEIPGYIRANDGKYYKYNYEINNIYYCPGNIIIDNFNVIDKYNKEKERYIVMDYFIIDLKEKTIKLYDQSIDDTFTEEFINIEKINLVKDKQTNNKNLKIIYNDNNILDIVINDKSQLIEYKNNYIKKTPNNYFRKIKYIVNFEASKLVEMGKNNLSYVDNLVVFDTRNLIKMGSGSLYQCPKIEKIYLDNIIELGDSCISNAPNLTSFEAPYLERIGMFSLCSLSNLSNLSVPNLKTITSNCLTNLPNITSLDFPNLIEVGNSSMHTLTRLTTFNAPNLIKTGFGILRVAPNLINVNVQKLIITDSGSELYKYINKNLYSKEDNIVFKETIISCKEDNLITNKLNDIISENEYHINEFESIEEIENKKVL